MAQNGKVVINLGSGTMPRSYAVNIDMYGDCDVRADIRCLPFKTGSVDEIEATHVLEHFGRDEARDMLKEWRRVLKEKGTVLISVPDLYRASKHLNLSAIGEVPEVWEAWLLYLYGSQEHAGQYHKWAYSPSSMSRELAEAGFKVVTIVEQWPNRPTPTFSIIGEAA